MKVDTKKIMRLAKKYSLLILVVLISIAIGGLTYSIGIDVGVNNINVELVSELDLNESNLGRISINDLITKNKVIFEKLESQTEKIPYQVIALGRSKEGTVTTLTNGVDGEKEIVYKVRYEDDQETNRKEVSSKITKKVINEVVEYSGVSVSRSGDTIDRDNSLLGNKQEETSVSGYTKVLDVKFTAYCLCKKCTGKSPGDKGYGVTASGYKITPGNNEKVIAVDPRIIPLGTKVYVQGVNGMSDYGYAIAADTGGAIKGNKIDIYVDEHGTTQWWTVGKAKVYIFE